MGVIQLLLENGIDIDARAKDGSTALHAASAYGTLEVLRFLLERGASAEIRDNQGRTARQMVSGTRDEAMKSKLLKGVSRTSLNRYHHHGQFSHAGQGAPQ